jgi:hypothetical protein
MGGDRPRNHVPARYVTVIDRAEGCVKYFYLDAKGSLIFDNGLPRLCKVEPYPVRAVPEPQEAEPAQPPELENSYGSEWNPYGCLDADVPMAYEGFNPFL